MTANITEPKQIKAQRSESEDLERVLDSFHALIAYMDTEFNFNYVNRAYALALGRDPKYFVGKNHFTLNPNPQYEVIFRKVVETGEPYFTREQPFVYKDRSVSYWDWRVEPIKDSQDKTHGVVLSLFDVSEPATAAGAIPKNELHYRTLIENMADGYALHEVLFDTKGKPYDYRYLEINSAFESILGLKREQVIGKTVLEIMPYTEPYWLETLWTVALNGQTAHLENYGRTFGRYFEISVFRPQYGLIAVFFADVTDRKCAEMALHKSAERLQSLVDQAPDGIFIADLDGRYTDVNSAGCRMLGYTREEIIGKTIVDILPPEDVNRLMEAKKLLQQGGIHTAEWSLRCKDGTFLPTEVSAKILPDGRWQGFVRDISERKKAERQLRLAATVFNNTMEGIIVTDADRNILAVNQAYTKITGYDAKELLGRNPRLHQPGRHSEIFYRELWQSLQYNDHWQGEIWNRRKDGELYLAWENISVVKDDHGRITNYIAVISDISAVKEVEKALRTAQANLTEAQRIAHLGSWETDLINGETYWSDEFFRICGLQPQSLTPTTELSLSLVHPDDRDRMEKAIEQSIENKAAYGLKIRVIRPDGSLRWVISEGEAIGNEKGKAVKVLGSIRDVTESELAQQQLQKYREQLEEMVAQRTAALEASNKELEAFSYTLAHDLRSPLRTITSFSQILQEEAMPKLTERENKDLQRIIKAGKYMAQLIDDILELARISRSEFTMETVDLSSIANSIIMDFKRIEPQRSIEVKITPDLFAKGDGQLLRIALENLLKNAWKYTDKRADACIEFGIMEKGDEKVYFVRDNGVGFDMRYADKLFKPFQRLHKPDEFQGTGIGLASVLNVIQRHNGKVWAESNEGQGTTFYFFLQTYQHSKPKRQD